MMHLLLIGLLWIVPVSGWAAISHDATTLSAQTNVTTPSYSHTRGGTCANPVAVIGITFQDATGTLNSVTYGGAGATQIGTTQSTVSGGNNDFVSLWLYKNPASGSATVQANFSESINDVVIHTSTYCGVDQTTSTGTAAGATGLDTTVTVNVTSAAGELVVDAGVISGTRTLTVGASQTQRVNNQSNHRHVGSEEAGAGTTTMSWSISTLQTWATVAAPLKPAADTTVCRMMLMGVGC